MNNPYLEEYQALPMKNDYGNSLRISRMRRDLVAKYAWAIPDDKAIGAIASLDRPVLEIGAGSGYWSSLLAQVGVDVVATDLGDPSHPHFFQASWHPVVKMGAVDAVREYGPGRVLLSVWPTYDEPWAAEALQAYAGDTFIYVGEAGFGCTGDERLRELLSGDGPWRQVKWVPVPTWPYIHDQLTVFKRR